MAKFLCRCGNALHTSGPIPHPDGLYIIAETGFDERADEPDFDLIRESTGVHRCRSCGRIWVWWDGWDRDPVSYRPEDGDSR
jgi:hypothetical protein